MIKKAILLCITLLLLSGCGNKNQQPTNTEVEDQTKTIENKAMLSDMQFQLKDAKTENEVTSFDFEITNLASETKYLKEFLVKVTLEDDSMITLSGVVEQEIASQEKITITCSYGGNLSSYKALDYALVD